MNVTFRQLELFRALLSEGSVSGAARLAGVTQSTASVHLRELADEIGLPLYEVLGRKVQLTETGRELAVAAREIQGAWEGLTQKVDALRGLERGRLRISVVSTAKYFVPRLLGRFCAKHPHIEISLEVLNRDRVVERLRGNLDDIYVMSQPPKDITIIDRPFLANPLVLIAPAKHSLALRRRIELKELAGERFVLRERGSGTRMAMDDFFRRRQFIPDVRLELGSNEAVREAVIGGLGIAVLSSHAVARGSRREFVTLDVIDFPIQTQWHLVYPAGKQLSPLAKVFSEELIAYSHSA